MNSSKKNHDFLLLILFLPLLIIGCNNAPQNKKSLTETKIDSLLSRMTLEEKIGQTALRGILGRNNNELPNDIKEAVRKGYVGAMLNVTNPGHVKELQRIAVEESPQGIPLIFGRDVIHGFKTIFPIPLGLAATWDTETVKDAAQISAEEATSAGIKWTFAPMLDICRDPRWGRIAESPGEDPFLASALAKAYVTGFQGSDMSLPVSMAACAKHYAAYGGAEGGRDYNTVDMSEQRLRNIYLKPFYAAAKAGAATFMASFNDLNGIPSSGNPFLLKTILRDEWGFNGFVVSDWNSVTEMINHGFCSDTIDAALKAASAGLDMEMMSDAYQKYLEKLVNEGSIKETLIDDFVRNILRIKFQLGLFDHPYTVRHNDTVLLSSSNLSAAKQAVINSLVLLKNDKGILPLSQSSGKIAVVGPLADAPYEQMGTWSIDGEAKDVRTPLAALKDLQGENKIIFAPGLDYSRDKSQKNFSKAIAAAKKSDVILFFGGEEAILSGEAHSRANINLPGSQEELIEALHKTGKPVILIIMAGRPISVMNIIDNVDAILMAWHPGTMGGPALADVLFGKAAPCGKLPVTWPKSAGQIPVYYNHFNTGRPPDDETFVPMDKIPADAQQTALDNTSQYRDLGFKPQFPFGYGLTYTRFEYNRLELSSSAISRKDTLTITAEITNTGQRTGTETVQLYIRDVAGSRVRPVKELKGFKKITLNPDEKQIVTFTINTDDLSFYDQHMNPVTEPGKFNIWIGPNSDEGLEGEFNIR